MVIKKKKKKNIELKSFKMGPLIVTVYKNKKLSKKEKPKEFQKDSLAICDNSGNNDLEESNTKS